jgi:8-oxo-dGTP pyrophosphatase MutT (NUDIX family)
MGKMVNGVWVDWLEKVKVLQKAVVQNNEGKLLALKRAPESFTRPNCWDLCGGSIDEEDVQQWKEKSGLGDGNDILIRAISREVKEETGLEVKKTNVIHIASGFNDKKGIFIVAIGYLCGAGIGEIVLSDEHSDYRWLTKEEFLQLDVGDDGGLIKAILGRLK